MALQRPPFLLGFAADNQGCGYNRIVLPMLALQSSGMFECRIEDRHWPIEKLKAAAPDVMVWQRQTEEPQIDMMAQVRAALPNCHFVYEIDDLLSEVPKTNYHAGAIAPNMDRQIRRALQYCDAATVTTPLLKEWLLALGAKKVHIIPNLVPGDKVRERKSPEPGKKLRVGWGGGISHGGDLSLIVPAMHALGDAVTWVFLGFKPEGILPVDIEWHDACQPSDYVDALYNLDVDVFIAPLEPNRFNEAKSNLRMIESGAACGAVIAQNVTSYRENAPPVFAYCETPDDWTREIRRFMELSHKRQRQFGRAMNQWVANNYTFEKRIYDRARAWLPDNAELWLPQAVPSRNSVVVVQDGSKLTEVCDAARSAGDHVLWARPGALVDDAIIDSLKLGFFGKDPVSAVIPLATDGINSFPRHDTFVPMDDWTTSAVREAVKDACAGLRLRSPLAFGPCVLLRSDVLNAIGSPDVPGHAGNVDGALFEWTARAAMRRMHCLQMVDQYVGGQVGPQQAPDVTNLRLEGRGYIEMARQPGEALSPAHRENIELGFFRRRWDGFRPGVSNMDETYTTWSTLKRLARGEHDPKLVEAAKFGEPIPNSEWVVLTGEHIVLKPDALIRLTAYLREHSGDEMLQCVYGDHEIYDFDGNLVPFFKTIFDLRYFQAHDYVTPVCAVRRSLFGIRTTITSEDFFRAVIGLIPRPCFVNDTQQMFRRLPHVLAANTDKRGLDTRGKELAERAAFQCTVWSERFLETTFKPHSNIAELGMVTATYLPMEGECTIIVPSRGDPSILHPCINMILQHTTQPGYKILVVGTTEAVPELGDAQYDGRVSLVMDPQPEGDFNWSRLMNKWGEKVTSPYICFMNDDVVAARKDWLRDMMANFREPDVAVVGARLIFPHGAVQHTSVIVHDGVVANAHREAHPGSPGYHGRAALSHEASCVTGSCMLVRRDVWLGIKFDENLTANFNDAAFCHHVRKAGYRIVCEMPAELHHREALTRARFERDTMVRAQREGAYFREHFGADFDPYWPEQFALRPQHGKGIVGANNEILQWRPNIPDERSKRVLYINDKMHKSKNVLAARAIAAQRNGDIPLALDVSGTTATLAAPNFAIPVAWDIRDWHRIAKVIHTLGVTEVVLVSMSGANAPAAAIDLLHTLMALDDTVDVTYAPIDAEAVCPRRNMVIDGKLCGEGFKKGAAYCQTCVNTNGSPFGRVDVDYWWRSWNSFHQRTSITEPEAVA